MKTSLFVVGLPLVLGGCASTLPPDVVSTGLEQSYAVQPVAYRSAISGYVARKPVDPKSWREQNRQQSPANGGAS